MPWGLEAGLCAREEVDCTVNINIKSLCGTVCPRSSDPFYIVGYYIAWVTTSWTSSIKFFVPGFVEGEGTGIDGNLGALPYTNHVVLETNAVLTAALCKKFTIIMYYL